MEGPKDAGDVKQAGGRLDPDDADLIPPPEDKLNHNVPPSLGSFLDNSLHRMKARAQGWEKPIPLPWPNVATALGDGLWPGLHILVGNTKSGKSQFALQIALHACMKAEIPILYIGLELGPLDLVARLLGLHAHRKWSRLYLGQGGIEEIEEIKKKYADQLRVLPFYLEVAPPYGWDYTRIQPLAETMVAKYNKPPFLVLDFLQLVQSPQGIREDLRERISRAAYACRAVARDLNATVMAVSSTARENYATLDGRRKNGSNSETILGQGSPTRLVGLGKESGEMEHSADSVLVLTREPWQDNLPPPEGTHVWLAVAGGRAITPSWVELRFDGGRFSEPHEQELYNDTSRINV